MKLCRVIFLMLFFIFTAGASAQEICNNGIDDDGDLLVDLNDTSECFCNGLGGTGDTALVTSLIPNPSFETMSCCPSTWSQVFCSTGWIQASDATSDYMNNCDFVGGAATAGGLVPFPDGNGILSGYFYPTWNEYVGSCLTATMTAGVSYTIMMNIAATPANSFNVGPCNGGAIFFSPVDITLYGSSNCSDLPFSGAGCPPTPEWNVLGSTNYTPVSAWGVIAITFTPFININAIIIGAPCTLPANYDSLTGCYPYFYYDNLILNTSSSFSGPTMADSGSFCSNDLVLYSHSDTAGGTWQWYKNGIALVGETDSVLDVSASGFGPGLFTALLTVGPNCDLVSLFLDTVLPGITIDSITNVNCIGDATGSASVSGSPGSGPLTYSWNTLPVQTTQTAINLAAGIYTVTVTDTNNCSSDIPVTIVPIHPIFSVNNPQEICFGETYIFNSHTYFTAGNYTDTLQTVFGCDSIINTQLVVNQLPVIITSPDTSICLGDNASLFASGGNSYSWSPSTALNSVTSPSPISNPLYSIKYFVTVTDSNSCINSDSVFITVLPLPLTNAGPDQTICSGSTTILSGTGGGNYFWAPDNYLSATIGQTVYASPVSNMNYVLEVTDGNNCKKKDTVQIVTTPLPDAIFNTDSTNGMRPFTVHFANNSNGAAGYFWDFGDGSTDSTANPEHTYNAEGTYIVTLIAYSPEGCTDTTQFKFIEVNYDTFIAIPNVFTPNGDGKNDLFMVDWKGFTKLTGTIYNRWGKLLAETDFINNGWNGVGLNGKEVVAGTYFYILHGLGDDGKEYEFNGFLELFR